MYSTVYSYGAESVYDIYFGLICTIVEVIMVRYCLRFMPNSQPKGRMC